MKNDPNARDGSISIMKRDGSIEPFVFAKLLRCIGSGFAAAGEPHDRSTPAARGLTEAVQAYLRSGGSRSPLPSEHLAELVELVLTQTGHVTASMAIRQHSQLRDQQRRWQRVAASRGGDGRYVQRRWNKSRVVQYLREEHGLDLPAARMIASRVEQLVFNCGLKVVTTGFVREMTRSELLAWGLLPGALAVKRPRRTSKPIGDATDPS